MVTGLMFGRKRQASALGRRITSALRRTASQEEKLKETEEEDRNEEGDSCVEKTSYKSRNLRSFAEEEKALEESKGSRVKE